jgi:ABC-type antimicrobial peptide transport system permease subunit
MIKNYFKTALRNLRSNKLYSAINIFGLAIGISSSLVIFLIVQYDFSFDKFENGRDRIYRLVSEDAHYARVAPFPMVDVVRKEVTGLEVAAPLMLWNDDVKVSINKSKAQPANFRNEPNIVFTDNEYFKLISYKWLAGSAESSLSAANRTVITEENAKRFFPKLPLDEIIGKEITFNDTVPTTVTGIVENLKGHTDFQFQTFVSIATRQSLYPHHLPNWKIGSCQLFLKLSRNAIPKIINTELGNIYLSHSGQSDMKFTLQPLSALHFSNVTDDFVERKAYLPALYGLMAVAGILLLLACINFINLTTAQASQRAKEIGIRKTLGGSRKQLMFQFLSETFLMTLLATFLSVYFAPLLLKAFADLIPAGIQFNIQQTGVILFLLIITFFVTVFSGIYPALILSSYKPVTVLKNQIVAGSGNTRQLFFRKTLTVSQFVFAQVFIIATLVVGKQIHLELNKNMGFKKDAIIYFGTNYRDTSTAKRKVLLQKFKAIPEIANVSLAGFPPSTNGALGFNLKYKTPKEYIDTQVRFKPADTNYINLYHIGLLAGMNLSYSDTANGLLVNERCSQMLGFRNPQEAIGKYVETNMYREKIPIVGVVSNFIQGSLHDEIMPLVLVNDRSMELTFNIALIPENTEGISWKTAINKITKAFKEIYPDTDLQIHFLDESIAKYYTADQNISTLLTWAAGLAIVISCLGLFGLIIYTTNQRTKEIGIRKVVGASVSEIISLLSKDFLKLILIAFLIAVPIVWIAANKWLENFAFKIHLTVLLFIIGGLIMLLPAVIILFLRTYKSATANLVESLRSE